MATHVLTGSFNRQVNIDYLLNSSLSHNAPNLISVSYDVGCIYCVRHPIRWTKYGYDTITNRGITWSVPMFHLNAHRERCRSVFSPYLLLYSARLNGEGVERRWAMTNGYAPSTKEMGPGSRRDVLDDVFGDQNWAKVTKLGMIRVPQCSEFCTHTAPSVHALDTYQGGRRRAREACPRVSGPHMLSACRIRRTMDRYGCYVGPCSTDGPEPI